MNKYLTTGLLVLVSSSVSATGFLVGFDKLESLNPDAGYCDINTTFDIYLMSGGDSSWALNLLPDSIHIGTYSFTSSLRVAPFEINLGLIEPLITNGVDEYLALFMKGQNSVISIRRLESEWFRTNSDLTGTDIPSVTFSINELRSGTYGSGPNEREMINYMDIGVTIIPEPSNFALASGVLLLLAVGFSRRRGFRNKKSH